MKYLFLFCCVFVTLCIDIVIIFMKASLRFQVLAEFFANLSMTFTLIGTVQTKNDDTAENDSNGDVFKHGNPPFALSVSQMDALPWSVGSLDVRNNHA